MSARILCLLALWLPASMLAQTPLWEATFDAAAAHGRGWNLGTTAAGTISTEGGALRLSHTSGNVERLTATSPPFGPISRDSTQEVRLRFTLRMSSSRVNVSLGFFDSKTPEQLPIRIRASGRGEISAEFWDGAANARQTLLIGYQPGTDYTVEITTTPASGTYSARVLADGAEEGLARQPYAHTADGADRFGQFNRLQIVNNGGQPGEAALEVEVSSLSITTNEP